MIAGMRTKSLLTAVFAGFVSLATMLGGAPGVVVAKTVDDNKAGISVDLPEGWKYEEGTPSNAKKATSDDGVVIYVMRFDRELPAQVFKRFADEMQAIMSDAKPADDVEEVTIHGLQAQKFTGNGRKDDNAVKFSAVLLGKDGGATICVIAVGPETNFKRHLRDIDAALESVRPK